MCDYVNVLFGLCVIMSVCCLVCVWFYLYGLCVIMSVCCLPNCFTQIVNTDTIFSNIDFNINQIK